MTKINLFFDPRTKHYFYTGDAKCFSCHKDIESFVVIQTAFSKKKSYNRCFCIGCINKIRNDATYTELKSAIKTDVVPQTAFPIFFNKPTLTSGKSVFEVADITDDGVKVIDRTRYSNKIGSSWKGAKIGNMEKVEELDDAREKGSLLILSAKHIDDKLEHKTKKLLEMSE